MSTPRALRAERGLRWWAGDVARIDARIDALSDAVLASALSLLPVALAVSFEVPSRCPGWWGP